MRFLSIEIREPLRRRPVYCAFIGGLTGGFFGLLNFAAKGFAATPESVAAGYTLGGLAVGAIVGSLAPEFRNRWLAGLITGTAMAVGFLVAVPFWGEDWGVPMSILMGLFCGIIYAGLLWDYRPNKDGSSPPLPNAR